MSLEELHFEIEVLLNRVGGNQRQPLSIPMKDWLLNMAQDKMCNLNTEYISYNNDTAHLYSTLLMKFPVQPAVVANLVATRAVDGKSVKIYEIPTASLAQKYMAFTRVSFDYTINGCDKQSDTIWIEPNKIDDMLKSYHGVKSGQSFFTLGRATIATTFMPSIYIYTLDNIKDSQVFVEYIKQPARMNFGGYTYVDNIVSVRQECELFYKVHSKLLEYVPAIYYNIVNDGQNYELKVTNKQLNSAIKENDI